MLKELLRSSCQLPFTISPNKFVSVSRSGNLLSRRKVVRKRAKSYQNEIEDCLIKLGWNKWQRKQHLLQLNAGGACCSDKMNTSLYTCTCASAALQTSFLKGPMSSNLINNIFSPTVSTQHTLFDACLSASLQLQVHDRKHKQCFYFSKYMDKISTSCRLNRV